MQKNQFLLLAPGFILFCILVSKVDKELGKVLLSFVNGFALWRGNGDSVPELCEWH